MIAPQVRVVFRLTALAAALVPLLALHALWRAARHPSPWPRRYLAMAGWICGVRIRIVGEPLTRDVVLLANHLTALDIPVLAGATGCVFVAKDDLARTPVVGWMAGLNRTVFVARADRLGVAGQVEQVRAALDEHVPLAIFPEGRTGDGSLLPFKPTLLAALDGAPAGVRAQPVLIDYGAATADLVWSDDEPGWDYARRILGRIGTLPVRLVFLEPFAPADFSGRKAIAAEAKQRIAGALASRP